MERHSKTNKAPIQQRDLPYDLITQHILTRLTIKSLLRFKSVSKYWYSTISSPQFASALLKFLHPSHTESLLIRNDDKFQILCYENGEMNLSNVEVDFDLQGYTLVLVGSCNGLVCLGSTCGDLFIIWNPVTLQFRKYLHISEDFKIRRFGLQVAWGFGYVSAVDDYKIVRIRINWYIQGHSVHIFSIKSDKWRKIDHIISRHLSIAKVDRPAVLVDETLYWMAGVPPILDGYKMKGFSFDLATGVFDAFLYLDRSIRSTIPDKVAHSYDEFFWVVKGGLSKYSKLFSRPAEGVITILKCPGETEQIHHLPVDLIGLTCENLIGFIRNDGVFTHYRSADMQHLGVFNPNSQPMKLTPLMAFERTSKIEIVSYFVSFNSPIAIKATLELENSNS